MATRQLFAVVAVAVVVLATNTALARLARYPTAVIMAMNVVGTNVVITDVVDADGVITNVVITDVVITNVVVVIT